MVAYGGLVNKVDADSTVRSKLGKSRHFGFSGLENASEASFLDGVPLPELPFHFVR